MSFFYKDDKPKQPTCARSVIWQGDYRRIDANDVLDTLYSIEQHRQELHDATNTLQRWLNGSEEFTEAWREFTNCGGITAADFKSFVDGTFRCRRIRRKKHLRLVANNKPQRIRLRR